VKWKSITEEETWKRREPGRPPERTAVLVISAKNVDDRWARVSKIESARTAL
jgi:hypothetical protein